MISEVVTHSVQIWRQKAAEGTLTPAEMRAAIDAIRKERLAANTRSEGSRATKAAAKVAAAPVDTGALLDELEGL